MKTSRTRYSKINKRFLALVDLYKKDEKVFFEKLPPLKKIEDSTEIFSLHSFAKNGYENIFIETEDLYDFLKNTKVISHGDISAQLFLSLVHRKYEEVEMAGMKLRKYNFLLNAPITKINTSLAVSICVFNKEVEGLIVTDKKSWDMSMNCLTWQGKIENGSSYIELCEKAFSNPDRSTWNDKDFEEFQVIANTIFYMNAFPDCVFDGVPKKAIIDEEYFTKKRVTITHNKKFLARLSTSPHLRRGHFRTYTNAFFINMKGKTIFIEPTFVKGKATTVTNGSNM